MQNSSFLRRWYGIGTILIIIMVGIGGMTRLTNSGLSMVDWEPIAGIVPPLTETDWEEEFNNYKQYPEYKLLNKNIDLAGFKKIFFWEYLHRIFGRFIGLYFSIPFIFLFLTKRIDYKESIQVFSLIILVALQGLLGWYMVKSGLSDNPNVSHIRLMIHLMAAMFLIIFTYIQYLRHSAYNLLGSKLNISKRFSILIILLVLFQIAYGAFTAGLKAGYAYNSFPLMDGKLLPPNFFADNSFVNNMFYAPYTIQFIHRLMGTVLLGIAFYLFILNLKVDNKELFKSPEIQFSMAVLIQFILGVLTLVLKIPIYVAVFHQMWACIVVILSAKMLYCQFKKS
tara:strand:- start:529 stop:1545 length:1017 start_codon:yes stop_codon:yes gene_type:complete